MLHLPNRTVMLGALNESPSEKEGKWGGEAVFRRVRPPLNESPSEKEGKSHGSYVPATSFVPQ